MDEAEHRPTLQEDEVNHACTMENAPEQEIRISEINMEPEAQGHKEQTSNQAERPANLMLYKLESITLHKQHSALDEPFTPMDQPVQYHKKVMESPSKNKIVEEMEDECLEQEVKERRLEKQTTETFSGQNPAIDFKKQFSLFQEKEQSEAAKQANPALGTEQAQQQAQKQASAIKATTPEPQYVQQIQPELSKAASKPKLEKVESLRVVTEVA